MCFLMTAVTANQWIEEVRSICGPTVPVILVGCKSDLRPQNADPNYEAQNEASLTYVTYNRGKQVANAIGAREYKECSSKNNFGVDDVFEAATRASMLVGTGGHERRQSNAGRSRQSDDATGCHCVVC